MVKIVWEIENTLPRAFSVFRGISFSNNGWGCISFSYT